MTIDEVDNKDKEEELLEETKKESEAKNEQGSNIICMICFEEYDKTKDFAKAKCGHIACSTCWTHWLDNCLECPMCKQRTRAKQLTKLA